MPNKNAKNAVNAPDVHVVAPSNMGKGLAYNETTKQYDVTISKSLQIVDNEVGVKVSPDAGNLLELRENGIYYGSLAEQSDFYVDAIGGDDDTGKGSIEKPFRTLNKALESLPIKKLGLRILLKEEQTHTCKLLPYTVASSVRIIPYGSKVDSLWRRYRNDDNGHVNEGYWQVYETSEYKAIAPTLNFVVVKKTEVGGVEGGSNYFVWVDNADLRIDGIKFRYSDPQNFGAPPNEQWRNLFGGLSGTIMFADCEMENSNSGKRWNLFSDHDGSVSFKVWNLNVTTRANEIAHIGAKMNLEVVGSNYGVGAVIGDGLHRASVVTPPEIIAMIANKGEPPKANYNNLIVNY